MVNEGLTVDDQCNQLLVKGVRHRISRGAYIIPLCYHFDDHFLYIQLKETFDWAYTQCKDQNIGLRTHGLCIL